MNRKIAGFLIIGTALISLAVWELWGRENISYKEILVLRGDREASSIIGKDDLVVKRMDDPPSKALRPGDEKLITGMETSQFVAGDSPLYIPYFRQSRFSVGDGTGKEILSVPEEWLLSMPQTIRRGDRVSFYSGQIKVLEAVVAYVKDGANQEVKSGDKDRLEGASVVNRIEIIADTGALVELSRLAGEGKRFTLIYSY